MEWGALVIPFLGVVVAAVFFRQKLVWWEVVLPLVAGLIVIALSKGCSEIIHVQDSEYWNGYAVVAEYYEDWNETVPCSHTKYCEDSEGDSYPCGTEHAYDVDYHSEYWQLVDNNGIAIGISEGNFNGLCRRWSNKSFVELHRDYHTDDGDKYVTKWPGSDETMEVVTSHHTYENRPRVSRSIYRFPEVDKATRAQYALFEFPKLSGYEAPMILGDPSYPGLAEARRKLEVWNAKLGQTRQIRMNILLFVNQPEDAGRKQQAYWEGGNKNELNICIGVDQSHTVKWVYVFSWTEKNELPVAVRDRISANRGSVMNLAQFVDWLGPEANAKWVRKRFREFSYLTVEPPLWAVILTYVLVTGITGGIIYWVVVNEIEPGDPRRRYPWRGLRSRM